METRELPVEPHSSKLDNHALGMKSSTLLDCTWTRATNLPQLQRDLRDSRERHLGLCSPLCSLRGSGEVCGTVHQRHVGTRWSKGGGASHTVLLKTILFLQRQERRLKEVRKAELGSHSHFLNVKKQQCLHRFLDVFLWSRKQKKIYQVLLLIVSNGKIGLGDYPHLQTIGRNVWDPGEQWFANS